MKEFFKKPIMIAAMIVTAVLLSFMVFAYATGSNNPVSNAIGVVFTPLQKGAVVVRDFFGDKLAYFTKYDELKAENTELKSKVRQNQADQAELETLRAENERLKQYLGLKDEHPDFQLVMGQIVAKEPGSFYTIFTLDKGSIQGISVNDAVVTAEGIVGIVYEVGTSYCKVMTILEEDVTMGGIVARTRDVGILEGENTLKEEGLCRLTLLPTLQSAAEGDLVETSGLGGVFPKGLIVGTVKKVTPADDGISYNATIEPAADLKSVRDVIVVTGYTMS